MADVADRNTESIWQARLRLRYRIDRLLQGPARVGAWLLPAGTAIAVGAASQMPYGRRALSALAVAALTYAVLRLLRDAWRHSIVVLPLSTPKELDELGWTGKVLAARVAETFRTVAAAASSRTLPLQLHTDSAFFSDVAVEAGGAKLSLKALTDALAFLSGRERREVVGEVVRDSTGGSYTIRVRCGGAFTEARGLLPDALGTAVEHQSFVLLQQIAPFHAALALGVTEAEDSIQIAAQAALRTTLPRTERAMCLALAGLLHLQSGRTTEAALSVDEAYSLAPRNLTIALLREYLGGKAAQRHASWGRAVEAMLKRCSLDVGLAGRLELATVGSRHVRSNTWALELAEKYIRKATEHIDNGEADNWAAISHVTFNSIDAGYAVQALESAGRWLDHLRRDAPYFSPDLVHKLKDQVVAQIARLDGAWSEIDARIAEARQSEERFQRSVQYFDSLMARRFAVTGRQRDG